MAWDVLIRLRDSSLHHKNQANTLEQMANIALAMLVRFVFWLHRPLSSFDKMTS